MALPPTRASGPSRPTRLGQWEVIAKIAGGGMSAVYLGRRVEPEPDEPNVVALKIVRHDVAMNEHLLQMFLEEGKLIARLVHPNIVRTLEVGGDAAQDFIAMELMLGKTFAAMQDAITARGVRLSPEIAAFTAARIADALHYAHELADEAGQPLALVHRDVNPANVFATFHGEVKLFDFGLAKITAGEPSGSQILAGKLSYLSPEQIMQMPLDRRSDVFSLGTTFWELLTSKRLFRRDSDLDTVRAVQLGPIPDPRSIAPEIPEELVRISKMALERNREHRYPTAAHLARDLDAFVFARSSSTDIAARLATLVDTLFPGEQKRQQGWLKPAITSSAYARAPSGSPPGPVSIAMARPMPPEPTRDSRETTAVMPNAPMPPTRTARDGVPRAQMPSAKTARDGVPHVPSSKTARDGVLAHAQTPREGVPVPSSRPSRPSQAMTARDGIPSTPMHPPATMRSVPIPRSAPPGSIRPTAPPRSLPPPPVAPQRDGPRGPSLPTPPPFSRTEIQAIPPAPESRTAIQPAPWSDPTPEMANRPSSIAPDRESSPGPSMLGVGRPRPKRAPIPLPSRLKKDAPPRAEGSRKAVPDPPDSAPTQVDLPVPPDRKR